MPRYRDTPKPIPLAKGQTPLFESVEPLTKPEGRWYCASCGGTNLVDIRHTVDDRYATAGLCHQCGKANVEATLTPL